MSKSPTATQLAAMKADAKQRAKAVGTSYNAMLEHVARDNGYKSWYAALQQQATVVADPQDEQDLIINPVLPPGFHATPNSDRDDGEIKRWWLKPFAVIQEDGRYDVQCLDGGAWDRPTFYGTAGDLDTARLLARTKLAKWREFLDRPLFTMEDESGVALTVDALDPRLPRAVLARVEGREAALTWMAGWEEIVRLAPELARAHLARARAR